MVESKFALSKKSYSKLKSYVDGALREHDRKRYAKALAKIRTFLSTVEHTSYKPVPGGNFNGEHIMRGSNAAFMYEAKIIPFATH